MEPNASSSRAILARGRETFTRLREIHAEQLEILELLGPVEAGAAIRKLEGEAQRLRSKWLETNQQAIARLCGNDQDSTAQDAS
jgi:hypothetical protein